MYVINKSALVSPTKSYSKSNLIKKVNQQNLQTKNRQYYSKRSISEHCSRNSFSHSVLQKRNSSKSPKLEQLNERRRRKSNQISNNPIKQNIFGDAINNDKNKFKNFKNYENHPDIIKKQSNDFDNNHENDNDGDKTRSQISYETKENSIFIPKEILCNYCDRFYSKASIEIHERKCNIMHKRRAEKLEAEKLWKEKLLRKPSHPPGHICYICGGRFTNASWSIHQKNCLKQWSIWNSLLPKNRQHKILPELPRPTENDIQNRIELAHFNGNLDYERLDALDDIMLEEAKKNQLPLELIC